MDKGIKLVIFDFDGTLCDTRRNIVKTIQMTLASLGLPMISEKKCAATIGLPLRDGFLVLLPSLSEKQADECVDTYRRLFEENKRTFYPQLFPGVTELIESLASRNIRMAIASSRSNASLREFCEKHRLQNYIEMVVGADDVVKAKPNPEPVLTILDRLHESPEHTLVVGDMSFDILMGRNAGCHTCGVTYGNGSRQELEESGAEKIIDEIQVLA